MIHSLTLSGLLQTRASENAEKVCVKTTDGQLGLTYQALNQKALSLTAEMLARGYSSGDKVVIGFGNTPEYFTVLFACFYAGLIAVPLDANLAETELKNIIDCAKPVAIIVDTQSLNRFEAMDLLCDLWSVTESCAVSADVNQLPDIKPDDAAILLYTSGSTGKPKGVIYTHQMIMEKLAAIKNWFKFDQDTVSLCLLPTHFGHGLICNCLSTFFYAGTLVICPPFNLDLIRNLWSIVAQHKVNTFSSVPTVIRLLTQYARGEKIDVPTSLRFVTCASAPISIEDINAFQYSFSIPLLNCYGLTETSGWSSCSPNNSNRNPISVGMPISGEIRIVNTDGKAVQSGEKGEVQIKGPCVMKGYEDNPELTAQVLREGWFSTGDIGEITSTGELIIHSRIKDIIIRAGKNIYPAEVDQVLMTHPDVLEAYTLGLRDDLMGERVASCVVRRQQSSLSDFDLIQFSQQKLASYKCPQQIAFIDNVPKTSRGKVNRESLKIFFEACE